MQLKAESWCHTFNMRSNRGLRWMDVHPVYLLCSLQYWTPPVYPQPFLTLRYFSASLHHCDCDAVHAVKYAATPWIGLLVSQKTGIWWSRRSTSRSLPFYLKDCIHLWAILMAVWVTNLRGPERVRTPISSHCLTTSDCYSRTRLSWTVSSRQVAEETNFFTTVWTQAMMRCFT